MEILLQHCSRRSQIVCYNVATESPIQSRSLVIVLYLIDVILRTKGNSIILEKAEKQNPFAINLKNPEQAQVVIYILYIYKPSWPLDGQERSWETPQLLLL